MKSELSKISEKKSEKSSPKEKSPKQKTSSKKEKTSPTGPAASHLTVPKDHSDKKSGTIRSKSPVDKKSPVLSPSKVEHVVEVKKPPVAKHSQITGALAT